MLGTPAGLHRPVESTPEMTDVRLFPKYCVVIYCVVFITQISVSASYFVSALHNARCSSSFCKTFHVSFNYIDTRGYYGRVSVECGSSNSKSADSASTTVGSADGRSRPQTTTTNEHKIND